MTNLVDGIPSTDMTSAVQTSLGKADTALQEHQDITGKEDKTNKVTSVDENSTNTQYPSAKLFYDKTTDLQEKYETLKNDHPPIEATNTELTLNGTGDFDLELNPKGNITQETREGYNLVDLSGKTTTKINEVTATFDNQQGTVTLNGTASANTSFDLITLNNLTIGDTYYISGCPSGGNPSTYRLWLSDITVGSGADYGSGTTYTIQNTSVILRISVASGVSCNNLIFKPLLVKSNTAKPFEPYGASPSPSYPSPVKVIDGSYGIEINNNQANFLKEESTQSSSGTNWCGLTFSIPNGHSFVISGKATATEFRVGNSHDSTTIVSYLKDNSYTVKNSLNLKMDFTLVNPTTNTSRKVLNLYNGDTLSLEEGEEGISTIRFYVDTNTTYDNQLVTYAIYNKQQTKTIDTSPNPLYSEDDLYFKAVNGDSFYDSLTSEQKASLESGSWYVHNEWGKYIITGQENWEYYSVTQGSLFRGFLTSSVVGKKIYSNYYNGIANQSDRINNTCYFNSNIYFDFIDNRYNALADFKTFLQTQYNNQTPVIIYYTLATPTNTKITNTTLITQLEALQNMKAYQDQTNISQTHNEAQADMKINAKTIMSLRYMQSEIEELKQAILNS